MINIDISKYAELADAHDCIVSIEIDMEITKQPWQNVAKRLEEINEQV